MTRSHQIGRLGILLVIAVSCCCFLLWWLYGDRVRLDAIVERESQLRAVIDEHPVSSIVIGSVVYLLTSLIPGTTAKSIVFGWLFGFWIALPIVCVSLTLAALICFLLVQFLFRDLALQKLPGLTARLNGAAEQGGLATFLLTLRLVHAPYSLTNYAAGASGLPKSTFVWTTAVGMFPSNVVFVLAGSQLPTLVRISEVHIWELLNWPLLISISLLALAPSVTKHLMKRFRNQSAAAR